jgi:DNA-binding NtrC family response regulator
VRRAVRAAARSALPVLVQGEEGTGKAELARAIHDHGERARAVWLRVDCGTLSPMALEAELFGVATGAPPDAGDPRPGAAERADGGTLYLAGVDGLPAWVQGLVLQMARNGEIRRTGDTRVRRVDVRLIAASARDLAAESREGRFRGDLLELLSLRRIDVPPLRARPEDLPALAAGYLSETVAPGRAPRLARGAVLALARHGFPGNQRELKALLDRIVERSEPAAEITEHDLARLLPDVGEPWPERYAEALRAFKRHLLERALEHAHGNQAEAARLLGVHPANLVRMRKSFARSPRGRQEAR